MRHRRYSLSLPATEPHVTDQDEAWFTLRQGDVEERLRFHDYGAIYERPGLYEQLFYERLKCQSPRVVASLLEATVKRAGGVFSELRCLDLGAGNGMMGEELQRLGVARIVGLDVIEAARAAAERDRPGVYDAFHVADLTCPEPALVEDLRAWRIDCLTTVAALGFGDIPPEAFLAALDLVQPGGWVGFNIRDRFLRGTDTTGFSRLVRELLLGDQLELHHLERYRHRISIDGRPLHYYAVVARKLPGRGEDEA